MNGWQPGQFVSWGRQAVFALLVLNLSVPLLRAQEPQEDPGEQDSLVQGLIEAIDILKAHHMPYDPADARRRIIEALVQSSDPRARILTKDSALHLERSAKGIYFDPGLQVSMSNGMAQVTMAREGSAAAEAEIMPGDQIEQIDGVAVANTSVIDMIHLLRNQQAGSVTVTVSRAGDAELREVVLERRSMQLPAVAEQKELPGGLCYLRVNGLYPGAGREIAGGLTKWAQDDRFGAILDLRAAGGGDIDSAAEIANLVAEPRALLYSLRDGENAEISVKMSEPGKALGMPIMVLIDAETSRAAEVLAATMAGSGKGAILVGEATAGDPEVRQRVRLSDNEWIYLATRKLIVGDGISYTGRAGIEPHVAVASKPGSYVEYVPDPPLLTDHRETTEEEKQAKQLKEWIRGDSVLIRSVDILMGLKALNIHGYGYGPRVVAD